MTQVRRPLIAALGLFTLAIALDRAGTGTGSDVVGTHAYALAAAAILLPAGFAGLRRSTPPVVISAAVGSLLGISAIAELGFFGDVPVHVAAVEVAFVALSALLGHAIGVALDQLDVLLTTAAVGESPAIDLEGATAANEIHTELARSRRHDRPLSVTVLSPTERGLAEALERTTLEMDRAIRRRFMYGSLARTVSGVLRRSDLLFEHRSTGRLIVLSPETDAEGTALLLERIREATRAGGIETQLGTASFPNDGIGFETLVEEAERDMLRASDQPILRAVERGGA